MNDKFVVVDSRVVWTGSTNVSDTCSGGRPTSPSCVDSTACTRGQNRL